MGLPAPFSAFIVYVTFFPNEETFLRRSRAENLAEFRFTHYKHSPRYNVMLNLAFKLNDLDMMLATGKVLMDNKTLNRKSKKERERNSCTLHQALHNMKHKKT
jgi:hypothetical protein